MTNEITPYISWKTALVWHVTVQWNTTHLSFFLLRFSCFEFLLYFFYQTKRRAKIHGWRLGCAVSFCVGTSICSVNEQISKQNKIGRLLWCLSEFVHLPQPLTLTSDQSEQGFWTLQQHTWNTGGFSALFFSLWAGLMSWLPHSFRSLRYFEWLPLKEYDFQTE